MQKKYYRDDPCLTGFKELDTVFKPPFLDVGSYITPNKIDKRKILKGEYVGIDIRQGPGVDCILDIAQNYVKLEHFNTVICVDTFEHVNKPWLAAKNIEMSMAKDAQIYFSVPFIWRFHEHPQDYWRMTPTAIKMIFENIEWTKIFYTDYFNTVYHTKNLNIHIKKQKAPLGFATISVIHMLGTKWV